MSLLNRLAIASWIVASVAFGLPVARAQSFPTAQQRDTSCRLNGPDDRGCRWWRGVGGFRRHERDLLVSVGGVGWIQDEAHGGAGWLDLRGVIASLAWPGGSVGLLGLARVGGGGGEDGYLATPTTGLGIYVRSGMDGTRFTLDARFPVDIARSEAAQSDAAARSMLLTGLAIGETDEPFWHARVRGGWVIRGALQSRFPLAGTWNIWLDLWGGYGSLSAETPSTAALGGLAIRQTSLIGGGLRFLVGRADDGYRFGLHVSVGLGSAVPTETLFPIHGALVLGFEPEQSVSVELMAGFTIIPINIALNDDSSLGGLALPSLSIRVSFWPVALVVPPVSARE